MIPAHIAVIGDGNRRWAKLNGLPEREGHLASIAPLSGLIDAWRALPSSHLTFWWSSADNLRRRDPAELAVLFTAYQRFFDAFDAPDVELRAYGAWRELLPAVTRACVSAAIERAPRNTGRVLSFLLAYNGDEEMLELIARIRASDAEGPVDDAMVRRHLPTGELPPVDLVIRTGGDPHLSAGFMMWQTRYAQLYFTDTLWPAFGPSELSRALTGYADARRRHGA